MEVFPKIIELLKERNKIVATMESCTGGAVASEITNYSGASEVLKYSAVTYSNEFKIKMGVLEKTIDTYSVYSIETADNMARAISEFVNSDYGIGITGKINTPDPANDYGENDKIYVAIYDKDKKHCYHFDIEALSNISRKENKENIIKFVGEAFLNILNDDKIKTNEGEC